MLAAPLDALRDPEGVMVMSLATPTTNKTHINQGDIAGNFACQEGTDEAKKCYSSALDDFDCPRGTAGLWSCVRSWQPAWLPYETLEELLQHPRHLWSPRGHK
jgi:hypothetical protein